VSTNLAEANLAERWTRRLLAFRWPIVIVWLGVLLVGGWASGRLSPLEAEAVVEVGSWPRPG